MMPERYKTGNTVESLETVSNLLYAVGERAAKCSYAHFTITNA